jgi:hypothetical protein
MDVLIAYRAQSRDSVKKLETHLPFLSPIRACATSCAPSCAFKVASVDLKDKGDGVREK